MPKYFRDVISQVERLMATDMPLVLSVLTVYEELDVVTVIAKTPVVHATSSKNRVKMSILLDL